MALVAISLWFDLLWALAVLGQQTWLWLTTLLVVATYGLTAIQRHPLFEKMVWMAVVGIMIDSSNMLLGLLTFADDQFPLWLVALWFAFTWYAGHLLPQQPIFPYSSVSRRRHFGKFKLLVWLPNGRGWLGIPHLYRHVGTVFGMDRYHLVTVEGNEA